MCCFVIVLAEIMTTIEVGIATETEIETERGTEIEIATEIGIENVIEKEIVRRNMTVTKMTPVNSCRRLRIH